MLPGTGIKFLKFTDSGYVGVQSSIYIDNLPGYVVAFIRCQVYAHMTDILRTAVSVNSNIVKENILESLRHTCFILRCNNKARSYAVAANLLLAVLKGRVLGEHVDSCLGTGIGGGTKVSAAGCHGADVND